MPTQLFRKLCAHLGFCCPYAFLRAARGQSGRIATRLGVSRRTVSWWRTRYKKKIIQCEECDDCQYRTPRDWWP